MSPDVLDREGTDGGHWSFYLVTVSTLYGIYVFLMEKVGRGDDGISSGERSGPHPLTTILAPMTATTTRTTKNDFVVMPFLCLLV